MKSEELTTGDIKKELLAFSGAIQCFLQSIIPPDAFL
jgi:hypothetical protein